MLGRRAGFVVARLVQINDGGKERNSEGRRRRKCERVHNFYFLFFFTFELPCTAKIALHCNKEAKKFWL